MRKSSFVALLLGTISGVMFALGMCMALITEWGAFRPGVVFGCGGILLGLVTFLVWRKLAGKGPIQFSIRAFLTVAVGIAGALALGVGMCFSMVWDKLPVGIAIGLVGIVVLFCLIPLTKGLKD